ncbi:hypothetical protein PAECIP111890_04752 [Paenibacillus sp. JJ-223]|nr:hypothetical protein PAECIP111890_04752 [Paenibacillus sp. JJ-223]
MQSVTQVIAHLFGFIEISLVVVTHFLRPIQYLNRAGIRIGGIGITPLRCWCLVLLCEQAHETLTRFAERFVVLRRVRNGFPDGFLFPALERIDVRCRMRRIQQVAEAVPVIDVKQPVHQVGLVVAIGGFQLCVQRVPSGLVLPV